MPSNTIHDITIRGFKSIASITVELAPINILIGANGSGKSNFVDAFFFLREVGAGRLREYVGRVGGSGKLLHFGSRTTERLDLRVSFNEWANPVAASFYNLTLAPAANDFLFFVHEEVHMQCSPDSMSLLPWQVGQEAGISNLACEYPSNAGLRQVLDQWQPYRLNDTSYMQGTADVRDNRFLFANGSNLPALLYHLRQTWTDAYALIVHTIRQVSPFFGDFDLNPIDKTNNIQLAWHHKGSDQTFYASSLSDGTLRFIALATLFLDPRRNRRSLILVDEPELGLHPYAIGLLAALIRQAAIDTQVIVSTQSSLLLDHFAPEDVLVADRVDGGTQLTRPDSARLEKWLEDYSLGQLWEKNELGGRPVPV